jgi:hypothetical protein
MGGLSRDERLRLAESLGRAYRAYRAAQAALTPGCGADARRAYALTRAALEALEAEAERVLNLQRDRPRFQLSLEHRPE